MHVTGLLFMMHIALCNQEQQQHMYCSDVMTKRLLYISNLCKGLTSIFVLHRHRAATALNALTFK